MISAALLLAIFGSFAAGLTLTSGSDDDDSLFGGAGDDGIEGGGGDDRIGGGAGDDVLTGGAGNDAIDGSFGNDLISGGDGNDDLFGGRGEDEIAGGAGNDEIFGGRGADILFGGDGDDEIFGQRENDDIYGGAGADVIGAGRGDDYVEGGDGDDVIDANIGDDTVYDDLGDDAAYLGHGDDFAALGNGDDVAFGGSGNDTIYGETGNDTFQGDRGDDMLDGGEGDDDLAGENGNDVLIGGAGADLLDGGNGNDLLVAGEGADVLTGGAGADLLVIDALSETTNVIEDFVVGEDELILDVPEGQSGLVFELVESDGAVDIVVDGTSVVTLRGDIDGFSADDVSVRAVDTDSGLPVTYDSVASLETLDEVVVPDGAIVGTEGNDTFFVQGGETVFGLGGNDTFLAYNSAGTFDDPMVLIGGEGGDNFILESPYVVVAAGAGDYVDTFQINATLPNDEGGTDYAAIIVIEQTGGDSIIFDDWVGHRLVLDIPGSDDGTPPVVTVGDIQISYGEEDDNFGREVITTTEVFVNGELFTTIENEYIQYAIEVPGGIGYEDSVRGPTAADFVVRDTGANGYDYAYLSAA